MTVNINQRKGERGNVLFLILIAVALFAALSYAVTQSTRSGGGDASKEKNLVSSATITQYPASVKTAIIRMMVSNSISAADLNFDKPPFTNVTTDALRAQSVFYPDMGGGATYTDASSDVMASGTPGAWVFNAVNRVADIGTNNTDASGVDIVAILDGVKKDICDKIHSQLGLAAVPELTTASLATPKVVTSSAPLAPAYTAANQIGNIGGSNILNGQPQGCFKNAATPPKYTYYHVLVER